MSRRFSGLAVGLVVLALCGGCGSGARQEAKADLDREATEVRGELSGLQAEIQNDLADAKRDRARADRANTREPGSPGRTGQRTPQASDGEPPAVAAADMKEPVYHGKPLREWVAQLRDKDSFVRSEAADALGELGPKAKGAVPGLVDLLQDQVDFVRVAAAAALGKLGPEASSAVPPLIAALKHKDGLLRSTAALALGEIGPDAKGAVAPLINALKDAEPTVRAAAADALSRIGPGAGESVPALIALLGDSNKEVRSAASSALEDVGKANVAALFETLKKGDAERQRQVLAILHAIGPEDLITVPGLADALKDREPEVRVEALAALKRIGPKAKAAVPAIVPLLKDGHAEVRDAAANALKKINAEAAPPADRPAKPATASTLPGPPVDLKTAISEAKLSGGGLSVVTIERYVQFGTDERARKSYRSDQADRAELDKEIREHRSRVRSHTYLLKDQVLREFVQGTASASETARVRLGLSDRLSTPHREDPPDKDSLVICRLPFRLHRGEGKEGSLSKDLRKVSVSWVNNYEWWFATKNETVVRCKTLADAAQVQKNDGFLYHPEWRMSDLVLVLDANSEAARHISRDRKNCRVDVVVEQMEYRQVPAWGFFLRSDLIEKDWDCQELVDAHDKDTGIRVAPIYFRTEAKNLPSLVHARLVSATLKDGSNQPIASFKRK